jgi:hypothetical protein
VYEEYSVDQETVEEFEALLKIAIGLFFENLDSGLDIHDSLETDMALRAAIAVSADLGKAIHEVSKD